MHGKNERGSALIILLLLSSGLVLTTAVLVSQGVAEIEGQYLKQRIVKARYEALGDIAAAKHEVRRDPALLKQAADDQVPIPFTTVYVFEKASKVYEMESTFEYQVPGGGTSPMTVKELAVVKPGGGTGLSKYAILSGEGVVEYWKALYEPNQGIGGTLYALQLIFGRLDDDHVHNPDWSTDGWFIWDDIYDWEENWHGWHELPPLWLPNRADIFMGEDWNIGPPHDWSDTDQVNFSDIASVNDLAGTADRSYTGDIEVVFDGDNIIITPDGQPSETYPLSDVDIIYTDGTITGASGTVQGQISIAAGGDITITGDITYEDSDGDKAMDGGDGSGDFVPNPDYDGDSNLGVLAEGNILLDGGLPTDTELNGTYFTRNGNIVIDGYEFGYLDDPDYKDAWPEGNLPKNYTGSFGIKDSLNVFGSLQYENFFLPYEIDIEVFFTGDLPYPPPPSPNRYLNRKMIYDPQLKDSPPPGYPGSGGGSAVFLGTFPDLQS